MERYSIGFLFSEDCSNVVLIKKNRPDWQKGLFNAPGGRVKSGEGHLEALVREFKEETGILQEKWRRFLVLRNDYYNLVAYVGKGDISQAKTSTDEEVHILETLYVLENYKEVVPNLRWMIPMALDPYIETANVENINKGPDGLRPDIKF